MPKNWQTRLPNNSAPYTSTIVFVVRKGNPKGIKDWSDLAKAGVSVMTPNPKTSGGARWNYLAAWAYARPAARATRAWPEHRRGDLPQRAGARFGAAARPRPSPSVAGDVRINWENEAFLILKEFGADKFEIVIPPFSILAEPTVAVVDKNADKHGTKEVAKAYLDYLYSDEGQDIAGKNFYRPRNPKYAEKYKSQLVPVKLFTIDEGFGGWAKAFDAHFKDGGTFDQIYARTRRAELGSVLGTPRRSPSARSVVDPRLSRSGPALWSERRDVRRSLRGGPRRSTKNGSISLSGNCGTARGSTMDTTLIVPGLFGSGADHWQSWFETQIPDCALVLCRATGASRTCRIGRRGYAARSTGHRGAHGSSLIVLDASRRSMSLPKVVRASPACCSLRRRIPVASDCRTSSRRMFWVFTPSLLRARTTRGCRSPPADWLGSWGSQLINLGRVGHINVSSGHGIWPRGLDIYWSLRGEASRSRVERRAVPALVLSNSGLLTRGC